MTFWSSQSLESELDSLVTNPDADLVDCNSITLRVGNEVYVTPNGQEASAGTHTKHILSDGEPFTIPPGQFGFIVTREVVTIPKKTMGFISIKATYKLNGLVNVSGFHVDPGWSGPLVFAVFNAGPSPVHLQRGLPLFLLWIANLDEQSEKHKTKPGESGISPKLINSITGEVGSVFDVEQRLSESIDDLRSQIVGLSDRMHKQDKTQFRLLLLLGIAGTILMILVGIGLHEVVPTLLNKDSTAQSKSASNNGSKQVPDKLDSPAAKTE